MRRAVPLLLPLVVGCFDARPPAQVLVPAAVDFPWDPAWDGEDDGVSAIVPLDVMVYDPASGEPIAGAAVDLRSDVALFVGPDEILPAEDGCDDCVWDAWSDQAVRVLSAPQGSPVRVRTDADGIARVYAVVDGVGGLDEVRVEVQHGGAYDRIRLLPW